MELLQSGGGDAGTSGAAVQEAAPREEQKDAPVARGKARGKAARLKDAAVCSG